MEPRASIKLVSGLFVFTGVVLFAASVFFLGERGKYFSTQHPLKAFFNSVTGLHVGAPVRLAGVVVGRVTRIRLPSPPEQKVLVELNVAGGAVDNIRRDSVARIGTSPNFSPIEKTKAALHGIKVVPANSYAKGEERPYGNRVYNRTNGISSTGAAASNREI